MPYFTYVVREVGETLQAYPSMGAYENLSINRTGWGYAVIYNGLRDDLERKKLGAKLHKAGLSAEEIERCVNTLMGE